MECYACVMVRASLQLMGRAYASCSSGDAGSRGAWSCWATVEMGDAQTKVGAPTVINSWRRLAAEGIDARPA